MERKIGSDAVFRLFLLWFGAKAVSLHTKKDYHKA